jgi:hypothetical protein
MSFIRQYFITIAAICFSASLAIADYQLERPVFSGGGGHITNTQYQMRTVVIGQNMTPMQLSNPSYATQANSGYVLMLAPNNAPQFQGEDDYFVADNLTVNPAEFNGASIGEVLNQMPDTYSDMDAQTKFGLALTDVSNTNGQWQYSIDNGLTWADIFTVSDDNALLLADDDQTRLRFKPDMDYMGGYPGDVTFKIWDQYRGTTGDTNVNLQEDSWVYTVSKNSGILIGNVMAVPVAVPSMTIWGFFILFGLITYFSLKIMRSKIQSAYFFPPIRGYILVLSIIVFTPAISNASFTQIQDISISDTELSYVVQFEMDNTHYLGVANVDYMFEQTSIQIYKWNNQDFESIQLISLNAMLSDFVVFQYSDQKYFVGIDMTQLLVFQWNQDQFTEFQQLTIPETFSPGFLFKIDDSPGIVISAMDGKFYIYQWNSTKGFEKKQYFMRAMADIKHINSNGTSYIIAYENGISPKIYKWMGTIFRPVNDFIMPQDNYFFSNQFTHNMDDYIIFKNYNDYSKNTHYSYGVYQMNNQQFSEILNASLPGSAYLSTSKINDQNFFTITVANRIEIYEWKNNVYELRHTIDCIYPCDKTKMFTINQELFVIAHYAEEFDPDDPFKPIIAGFYVYKNEERKPVKINDIICALKILSGQTCDYSGMVSFSDHKIDLKDVLFCLNEIAN